MPKGKARIATNGNVPFETKKQPKNDLTCFLLLLSISYNFISMCCVVLRRTFHFWASSGNVIEQFKKNLEKF